MRNLILVLVLLASAVLCRGFDVSISEDAAWKPATEQQLKLLPRDPRYQIVDFSLCKTGGAGMVMRAGLDTDVSKQLVQSTVQGFVSSVEKPGVTITRQESCSVGKLNGVMVAFKHEGAGAYGVFSYLVFTQKELYVISIYGPANMTASYPAVKSYLDRVQIAPSVVPGDINADSAYEIGRRAGFIIGRIVGILMVCALIITCVVVFVKRRKEMGPPPLNG